jgi:hypothetical protein
VAKPAFLAGPKGPKAPKAPKAFKGSSKSPNPFAAKKAPPFGAAKPAAPGGPPMVGPQNALGGKGLGFKKGGRAG